jgi:hypothetical protein
MLRAALFVFVSAFATAVAAAPVPRASEKELIARHWGKTEGPGEFELNGKQLTLRSVGQPTQGLIKSDGKAVPRATRTVSGDFEATVKLLDASPANKDAKHSDAWPGTRAGLFISGGGFAIELHLYQYHSKVNGVVREEPTRTVWVDTWFPRGGQGSSLKTVAAGKSVYLRITRKGQDVTVSHSLDGKEWSKPFAPRKELDFPAEVTVGVYLAQSTHQFAHATFEGLTVEKLEEKK